MFLICPHLILGGVSGGLMHGPETRETRVLWRLRIAQKQEKMQAVHGPEPRENACIAEATIVSFEPLVAIVSFEPLIPPGPGPCFFT